MHLGILVTGVPRSALAQAHGSYEAMVRALLTPLDPDLRFSAFDARADDGLPAGPEVCDGWIVTGSPHGVYEALPWMAALKTFLLACDAATRPVVGLCFGHQILAEAHGGRVEKVARGYALGPHTYRLAGLPPTVAAVEGVAPPHDTPDQPAGRPASLTLLAFHQDQVVDLPPGAEVLASSDFCPYAALRIGRAALTFQGHPEFTPAYETDLIHLLGSDGLPADRAEAALVALGDPATPQRLDSARVGRWMLAFLRAGGPGGRMIPLPSGAVA